jgi:hypothetical protein
MVKDHRMVLKRVPRTFLGASSCPCYQSECQCYGEETCACAQPACSCAPKVHYREVEVAEEVFVPEEYTVTEV